MDFSVSSPMGMFDHVLWYDSVFWFTSYDASLSHEWKRHQMLSQSHVYYSSTVMDFFRTLLILLSVHTEFWSSEWRPCMPDFVATQHRTASLVLFWRLWFFTQPYPQHTVALWTDTPQSAWKPRPYVQGLVTIPATFCCWASWHCVTRPSGLVTAPCPHAGIAACHSLLLPLNTGPQCICKQGGTKAAPWQQHIWQLLFSFTSEQGISKQQSTGLERMLLFFIARGIQIRDCLQALNFECFVGSMQTGSGAEPWGLHICVLLVCTLTGIWALYCVSHLLPLFWLSFISLHGSFIENFWAA